MQKIKEEELNGGLASCPTEQQKTSLHTDEAGRVTAVTYRNGPYSYGRYTQVELQRTTFLPAPASSPFGTLPGFCTSQGIITPPREPIGVYILEEGVWILHASPPGSYY